MMIMLMIEANYDERNFGFMMNFKYLEIHHRRHCTLVNNLFF
jgi:hypothetical protein